MKKTAVYLMPGLGCTSLVFEQIKLPENDFEMIFLEWELPLKNESLADFAKRFSTKIKHENPVLLGLSFGGLLVQEIAKHIAVKKIILISSVKSRSELPKIMKFANAINLHKIISVNLILKIIECLCFIPTKYFKRQNKLFNKYIKYKNFEHIKWGIREIVSWQQANPLPNTIHIQGENDVIFCVKNIKNCIILKKSTHLLVIEKYSWLNKNLPNIILN